MRDTEFLKRQYGKALEIWQERAMQEYLTDCEKQGTEPLNEWKGLFHIIAEDKMQAYAAGVDGLEEPNILAKLDEVSEGKPPIGVEFFTVIRSMIYQSYLDGQNARQ